MGSALVRESEGSATGDDDKIYFFFTENSQEQMPTYSNNKVARVARVCKVRCGGQCLGSGGNVVGGLSTVIIYILLRELAKHPIVSERDHLK